MAKASSKHDFSRLQTQGEAKADKGRRTGYDQSKELYGKYEFPLMLEGLLQSVSQTFVFVHVTLFNSMAKSKDNGHKVQSH